MIGENSGEVDNGQTERVSTPDLTNIHSAISEAQAAQDNETRIAKAREIFGNLPELQPRDDQFDQESYEIAEFDADSQYLKINKTHAIFSLLGQISPDGVPSTKKQEAHDTTEYKKLGDKVVVKRETTANPMSGKQEIKIVYRDGEQFMEYKVEPPAFDPFTQTHSDGSITVAMGIGGADAGEATKARFDTHGTLTELNISTNELEQLNHARKKVNSFGWRGSIGSANEKVTIKGGGDWTKPTIESDDIWETDTPTIPVGQPFISSLTEPYQLLLTNEDNNITVTRLNTLNGGSIVSELPKSIAYENARNAITSSDPHIWTTAAKETIPTNIQANKPPAQ